jgi:hypothetical protein
MFRRMMLWTALVAAFGVASLAASGTAQAWWGYYNVPRTPYGYAVGYGYAYPGAPFYQGYGPPYYQGYGPPYYQGYGPPYYQGYGPPYVGGYRMYGYSYPQSYYTGYDGTYW